jgi:hypothetical protein
MVLGLRPDKCGALWALLANYKIINDSWYPEILLSGINGSHVKKY